jgi:hypothetical protein
MIEWPNKNWINERYFDDLQKYQLIESFRRNPERLFHMIMENTKMKEEMTVLKRQLAEQNRP